VHYSTDFIEQKYINMNNSKLLLRHAYILDILCLVLCLLLLYLQNTGKLEYWALSIGAIIALVAFVVSLYLFIKARKIDREESRRIEREILENASKEDAVDKAIEDGDIVDEQENYKNEDEQ
jgi:Ca2+/Na+ antiporter